LADQLNLDGALAEFTQSVRLAPDFAAAHYNRGRVLIDLRRNDEAKPELETATRLDPGSSGSWYLLGLIAKQAARGEESIPLLQKAAVLDPNNADIRYMLGQELLRQGQPAGAIEQWRKAIQIRPQYNEAVYNLSRLLMKTDPEEGQRLKDQFEAQQAEQHITDRAQTLGNFALTSADARDWPQAIAQLKEALQLCGACSAKPLLHKDLGLIYCRSGDLKNGRAELLEARNLSPGDPDVTQALNIIAAMQK
jgi:tetratricopeptide (TPR) repeat protein